MDAIERALNKVLLCEAERDVAVMNLLMNCSVAWCADRVLRDANLSELERTKGLLVVMGALAESYRELATKLQAMRPVTFVIPTG